MARSRDLGIISVHCSPLKMHFKVAFFIANVTSNNVGAVVGDRPACVNLPNVRPSSHVFNYPLAHNFQPYGSRVIHTTILSSVYARMPLQKIQQPLPQYLQPFKGPTSSFGRLQQRAKLSNEAIATLITFLEDLKNFRRYSDQE